VKAGFIRVFIGIESPNKESLVECNKTQNLNRDLLAAVKIIHNHGLGVMGGFILGFDSDTPSIFKSQIDFIQQSGIVMAMVGLLNAPSGTRLYDRLKKENRLADTFSGDFVDCSINFIPKMDKDILIDGYMEVLQNIYSPKNYYERVRTFLRDFRPSKINLNRHFQIYQILGGFNTLWTLGFLKPGRRYFWQHSFWSLMRNQYYFNASIELAGYGYHFHQVAQHYISNYNYQKNSVHTQ
jgi:radical SAM superfamily enzyme YgiQ (UPF0313 family)